MYNFIQVLIMSLGETHTNEETRTNKKQTETTEISQIMQNAV